jgi:hypothetical protein
MEIRLDKNHILASDDTQYMLKEVKIAEGGGRTKEENIGKEYTNTIGYYNSIDGVLRAWAERKIRKSDAETFQQLMDAIKGVQNELAEIKHELQL